MQHDSEKAQVQDTVNCHFNMWKVKMEPCPMSSPPPPPQPTILYRNMTSHGRDIFSRRVVMFIVTSFCPDIAMSSRHCIVVFTTKRSQAKVYKMYFGISSV